MSVRVLLDTNLCHAYGVCVGMSPDVFDLPKGALVATLLTDVVDDERLAELEETARYCPAAAITVVAEPEPTRAEP